MSERKPQPWEYAQAWDFATLPGLVEGALPPDLTSDGGGDWCGAHSPVIGEYCTRQWGHTGRHAAGDGVYIIAVWPEGHR